MKATTKTSEQLREQIAELRRQERAARRAEEQAEREAVAGELNDLASRLGQVAEVSTAADAQRLRELLEMDQFTTWLRTQMMGQIRATGEAAEQAEAAADPVHEHQPDQDWGSAA
jgi:hypothetical protein